MNLRMLVPALVVLPFIIGAVEPAADKESQPRDKGAKEDKAVKPEDKPKEENKEKPKPSETSHSLILKSGKLDYSATAGTLPIRDEEGKVTADIFFIAYTRTKEGSTTAMAADDAAHRPITFAFNG